MGSALLVDIGNSASPKLIAAYGISLVISLLNFCGFCGIRLWLLLSPPLPDLPHLPSSLGETILDARVLNRGTEDRAEMH